MKALFEDEMNRLIIGREDGRLILEMIDGTTKISTKLNLSSSEAIKLESFIGKMNTEIQDSQEPKTFWNKKFI